MADYINRQKGSSHPREPGGTYLGVVRNTVENNKVIVYIPALGATFGPMYVAAWQLPLRVGQQVICTFLDHSLSEVYAIGPVGETGNYRVTTSNTPPSSPTQGDLWFDTSTSTGFIYYNSEWVELGGGSMSPMQATSSTRPSSPFTGQLAYETDTKNLVLWNGASWMANGNAGYKIGDTGPGGGIIFFIDRYDEYTGFTYLEVAPVGVEVQRTWATGSLQNFAVSGADSKALGGGYQNTLDIVAQTGNVAATCAAAYCADLVSGGRSDWYLPSISEIKTVYNVVHLELGVGGFASPVQYWSSSEGGASNAFSQNFGTGAQFNNTKPSSSYVRPVRRF